MQEQVVAAGHTVVASGVTLGGSTFVAPLAVVYADARFDRACIWRYVGMAEVPAFVRARVGSELFFLLIRLGVADSFTDLSIPVSIILMNTLTAFGGLVAVRVVPAGPRGSGA